MRVITLEEHYRSSLMDPYQGDNPANAAMARVHDSLTEAGDKRIAAMDRAGIDVQVLSHTTPSPEILDATRAIPLAQKINDELAAAVSRYPKRFAAFATLPVADPPAAADELERTVKQFGFKGAMINGMPQSRFLDDPSFYPIFERAEALGVPIYLHPAPPPEAIQKTYFSGLDPALGHILSIAGWGWHAELGLHTIRLIATGVFDRFPKFQLIIGHMGEMIPFFLARINMAISRVTKLQHPFANYFNRNIHITTSGLFTTPPLYLAIEVIGADRIMFSIDYPYSSTDQGRTYLDSWAISPGDFAKITHLNAERLLGL